MTFEIEHLSASEVNADEYLSALNLCFPGWGNRESFEWTFRRSCAGRIPDILLLRNRGRVVAGSAVVYRKVRLPDGREFRSGVMCGSWTLPEARGRGAFTRVIEESRIVASDREAPLLLAFVTAANPSRRRLEAAGAVLYPTSYLRGGTSAAPWMRIVPIDSGSLLEHQPSNHWTTFSYSPSEWRAQFLKRPGPIECIGVPDSWSAVVETAAPFERIHALSTANDDLFVRALASLSSRAAERRRDLFFFDTVPNRTARLSELGFELIPGFITVLATTSAGILPSIAGWHLQNGDRM